MSRHRTVFLVGSGAVANAWVPVIAALRSVGIQDLSTCDGAAFAMANLVYMARLARIRHEARIGQSADEILTKLAEVKRAIADALNSAEIAATLAVRPEFEQIFNGLVCEGSDQVCLVTTNWDGVVEHAARRYLSGTDALYLHGRAAEPARLYLPSEIVEEPYRTPPEKRYLNNARAYAARAVGEATRVVIYGLSISALDAELGALLFAGVHGSSVKEIQVIDPSHEGVVERLSTLGPIGTPQLPIYSRSPLSLSVVQRFPSD